MNRWKLSLITTFWLLFIVLSTSHPAYAAGPFEVRYSVQYRQTIARQAADMINDFRMQEGNWVWSQDSSEKIPVEALPALEYDYNLEALAMERCADIAIYGAQEIETRPDGCQWTQTLDEYAYACTAATECKAWKETPENCVKVWTGTGSGYSPKDTRSKILDPQYNRMALASCYYNEHYYWVLLLANAQGPVGSKKAVNSTVTVTREIALEDVKVELDYNLDDFHLSVGETYQLPRPCILLSTHGYQNDQCPVESDIDITYEVENPTLATITQDGEITALQEGYAELRLTALGQTSQVMIWIQADPLMDTEVIGYEYTPKGIRFRWKPVRRAEGYYITRDIADDNGESHREIIAQVGPSVTEYTDTDLSNGDIVAYCAFAYREDYVNSCFSTYTMFLSPVKITEFENEGDGLRIRWKTNPYADGYKIYRKIGSEQYQLVKNIKKGTTKSWLDKKLVHMDTVKYKMAAYIEDVGLNIESAAGTAKGFLRLEGTNFTSRTGAKTSMKLTWKKVKSVSGYEINYAIGKAMKESKTLTVKGASTLKTTVNKLTRGKNYYVQIRSYKKVDGVKYYSAWSDVKKVAVG